MDTVFSLVIITCCYKFASGFHNSNDFLTSPELVRKYNYPFEEHQMTTDDGYILTLHRIPHGIQGNATEKTIPIILQHGLASSSADFLLFGESKSLGFVLADQGYDVWLMNCRGNIYSMKHKWLSPSSREFWDFSWHEMGMHDLPSTIDYVLKVTGSKQVVQIGHSQGTASFFVMMSMKSNEYAPKVKLQISLSPTVYLHHSKLLSSLAPLTKFHIFTWKIVRAFNFFPRSRLITWILVTSCRTHCFLCYFLYELFFIWTGRNPIQLPFERMSNVIGHFPLPTSFKQGIHFEQVAASGVFGQFDYYEGNRKVYGTDMPPSYNLSAVTTPLYIFYGDKDPYNAIEDIRRLSFEVQNVKEIIFQKNWSHYDYLYGVDAYQRINPKVLEILKKKENSN